MEPSDRIVGYRALVKGIGQIDCRISGKVKHWYFINAMEAGSLKACA